MIARLFGVALLLSGAAGVAIAEDEEFQEGVHYELISPPQPTSTGNKVEVVEVFWYGCPHCYRFEPYVERWLKNKPANAEFVRIPGVFRPSWENHARAFYTAQALGVWDKIHMPLFDGIHQARRNLETEEALRDFFAEHGVNKDDFNKTFRSFAVESKVNRAKGLVERYGINGVPALIVNGKYRFSNSTTGSSAATAKLIDYLVAKESKK